LALLPGAVATTGLRSALLISRTKSHAVPSDISKVLRSRQNRPVCPNRFEQRDLARADVLAVGKIETNEKMITCHGYPGKQATVTYGEQVY
jgi:hypothetical protein